MSEKSPRDCFPYLDEETDFPFPPASGADRNGIVCTGGNLSPGLVLSAYRRGIFPWYSEGEPILWWSPDPRFVLFPDRLHVSATMRKTLRRRFRDPAFSLTLDRCFPKVMRRCAGARRPGQRGTWITRAMIEGYTELHRLGFAHSAEAWRNGRLVGGLYGLCLGSIFFGESMFSLEDDASKAVFIPLVWRLAEEGFTLIDSQVYTEHLAGLGAVEVSRNEYLRLLALCLSGPRQRGNWELLFPGFPASRQFNSIVRGESGEALSRTGGV